MDTDTVALDTTVFEVTTIHRVSFHDYFPDYKRLEAFFQGMDIVRHCDDMGAFTQTTIDMNDEQFARFMQFAKNLNTSPSS